MCHLLIMIQLVLGQLVFVRKVIVLVLIALTLMKKVIFFFINNIRLFLFKNSSCREGK